MTGEAPGAALPLVLLPGVLSDARLFAPQIAMLSASRAVTVAPCAAADTPAGIAAALAPILPPRFALAGHGLGGVVAMALFRLVPERIAGLAFMNTYPLAEPPALAAEREPRIARARAGRLAEVARDEVPAAALAPGAGRLAVLGVLDAMAAAFDAETYARQSRALQRRADSQATLRRMMCPTLVLCGAHDTLAPVRRHTVMAQLVRPAVLEVIEEAGHLPSLEAPDAVTQHLRVWLDGLG